MSDFSRVMKIEETAVVGKDCDGTRPSLPTPTGTRLEYKGV